MTFQECLMLLLSDPNQPWVWSEEVEDNSEMSKCIPIFELGSSVVIWSKNEFIRFICIRDNMTVVFSSVNAIDADTDGHLCVYLNYAGDGITVKNRLGSKEKIDCVAEEAVGTHAPKD